MPLEQSVRSSVWLPNCIKNKKSQVALVPIAIEKPTFVDGDKDDLDNNLT